MSDKLKFHNEHCTFNVCKSKIPDWTKWLAVDSDGEVWAYGFKPELDELGLWIAPEDLHGHDDEMDGIECCTGSGTLTVAVTGDWSECLWPVDAGKELPSVGDTHD